MNKRIRYIKHDIGYVSMRMLLGQDGKEYRATLSDDQLTGGVADSNGNVFPVKGSSPHKTKIAIKKQLELLGVVFQTETRSIADDNE